MRPDFIRSCCCFLLILLHVSKAQRKGGFLNRCGSFLAALTIVLTGFLTACSSKRAANEFVVGMDLSYPPFETIDTTGKPTGVSVDLAEALGHSLGRPLRIENIPFTGLIPSLKTGKIDCIISSMTDTPELSLIHI